MVLKWPIHSDDIVHFYMISTLIMMHCAHIIHVCVQLWCCARSRGSCSFWLPWCIRWWIKRFASSECSEAHICQIHCLLCLHTMCEPSDARCDGSSWVSDRLQTKKNHVSGAPRGIVCEIGSDAARPDLWGVKTCSGVFVGRGVCFF